MVTLFNESKAVTKSSGISATENASKKVIELLKAEGKEGHGLRLSVTAGGCSGYNYGLFFDENSLLRLIKYKDSIGVEHGIELTEL